MNHNEAVEQMAVERYLLDELDAGAREEFEDHMFSCPECALDSRAGTMFMEEATSQLGEITSTDLEKKPLRVGKESRRNWFGWLRPAFAVPVFASLMALIGYQNLVTLPALRATAGRPVVFPVAPLSGATRGEARPTVTADRMHGAALPVVLPLDPAMGTFVSYSFELLNPKGKLEWIGTIPAPAQATSGDIAFTVLLPGGMLEDGAYALSVSGIKADGQPMAIEHFGFDVSFSK